MEPEIQKQYIELWKLSIQLETRIKKIENMGELILGIKNDTQTIQEIIKKIGNFYGR